MKVDFQIDENDFLMHQLFVASRSAQIKKKRQRSRVVVPLFYAALAFLFLTENKYALAIGFLTFALLWFFLYPYWERRRFINHYRKFIKENYTGRLGRTATLAFYDDFIIAKDNGSESKVLTTEIEQINEIPTTIFVRLKGGQSFILPKDKIENVNMLIIRLKELANHLRVKYEDDDKWEWK
jgi:uncharacterized protein YlzI (FlbEa/FlbD family)